MSGPSLISRASIGRGPCMVTFNGAKFFFKDGLKLGSALAPKSIEDDAQGEDIDAIVTERAVKLTGTPTGDWEAIQAVALPYASAVAGSSAFGSDTPVAIQTRAGTLVTFMAAAVTKMPDLTLRPDQTIFGPMEFTCIGPDGKAWDDAAHPMYTVTSNAWPAANNVAPTIIADTYAAAWGSSSPWNSIATRDGWKITWDLGLVPLPNDAIGLADMTFTKLVATLTAIPQGFTEAQMLTAQLITGAGAGRGRLLSASALPLTLTGAYQGKTITVAAANMLSHDQMFDLKNLRVGETAWRSVQAYTTGPNALAPIIAFT